MVHDEVRHCWCGTAHHRLVCKQGSGCAPCDHHRREYRRAVQAHKNMVGPPVILRREDRASGYE